MSATPDTNKQKPKASIIAYIFLILSIIILSVLGTWQMQRLEWKTQIINDLNKARETDPKENSLNLKDFQNAMLVEKRYVTGHVTGQYNHNQEIIVGPRTYEGVSGYHVITPFTMIDKGVVLINRGWVPEGKKEQSKRAQGLTKGVVKVFGMARLPEQPNQFVPENDPETGQWFWPDIDDIQAHFKIKNSIAPYIFYAERNPDTPSRYPVPEKNDWMPNNNHLGYAIFWYSMIPSLIVIFYLRFYRNPEDKS